MIDIATGVSIEPPTACRPRNAISQPSPGLMLHKVIDPMGAQPPGHRDGGPGIDAGGGPAPGPTGAGTRLTDNLAKVGQRLPAAGLSDEQAGLVARRVEQVTEVLAGAPKTLKWRARAKIGRRVPWYDLPEEVG